MKSKIQTSNITINYYSMPWATVLMYLLFGNIYLVSIQYFHQQPCVYLERKQFYTVLIVTRNLPINTSLQRNGIFMALCVLIAILRRLKNLF